jgi:hypothetical protein
MIGPTPVLGSLKVGLKSLSLGIVSMSGIRMPSSGMVGNTGFRGGPISSFFSSVLTTNGGVTTGVALGVAQATIETARLGARKAGLRRDAILEFLSEVGVDGLHVVVVLDFVEDVFDFFHLSFRQLEGLSG